MIPLAVIGLIGMCSGLALRHAYNRLGRLERRRQRRTFRDVGCTEPCYQRYALHIST